MIARLLSEKLDYENKICRLRDEITTFEYQIQQY